MTMQRRQFMAATAAAAASGLARPALAKPVSTLRFRPTVDLTFVDPMATTASSTRYLAHMS